MLTKKDMVNKIRDAVPTLNGHQAQIAYETVFNTILDELAKGERVTIHGFGSFNVVNVPAHEGRNIQTGKKIKIPAKNRVKFTQAAAMKETVNKK